MSSSPSYIKCKLLSTTLEIFLFSANAFGYTASGCMVKMDEDSDGDIKVLGDNQMDNLEESQKQQFKRKDGLGIRYEKYIQVSKKTSNCDVSKIKTS